MRSIRHIPLTGSFDIPSRGIRRNPSSAPSTGSRHDDHLVDRSAALYEMWHMKPPKELLARALPFPELLCPIGVATEIVYESDKWEADGDHYDYVHEFEQPTVYADCGDENVRSTAALLGVASLDDDVHCAKLARVKHIIYIDKDGEKRIIKFGGRKPMLCSTLDRKAVFVNDKQCPIVVRGRQMRVTKNGIVK